MNYRSENVIIKTVQSDSVIVFTADPGMQSHSGCKGCGNDSGCGVCAKRPGVQEKKITISSAGLQEGGMAILETIEVPFFVSLFLVFLLPLALMAGLPGLALFITGQSDPSVGFIAGWGSLGLGLAFFINLIIDRLITYTHPPRLTQVKQGERLEVGG